MHRWLRIAFSGPVVRRGLKYAVVVGAILITINHGDAILAGRVTIPVLLKMALTVVVPYCVSVLSSVGAMLDLRDGSTSLPDEAESGRADPGDAGGGVLLSEAELREIALFPEMNPGPVCRLALDGTVLRANRAALSAFGEGLVGSLWTDALPGLDGERWKKIVNEGERVWLETEAASGHLGFTIVRAPGSDQVFVYGTDITALKAAESRLGEMARFPEMNPGPVLRVDLDGTVLLANRAARMLFGSESLVGMSWRDLCPGVDDGFWARTLCSDSAVDLEVRVGGRQMLFTHTHDGDPGQVFVYGADLTELKVAERALSQSERMATLGTLAAGVAHELNNPSAAVMRAAEHLRNRFAALQHARIALGHLPLEADTLDRLSELELRARERAASPREMDPIDRSDREYDVELWLEDREIEDDGDLAPGLVGLGFGVDELDELAHALPEAQVGPVITWLSRTYPVYEVLDEIGHGATRISEIVTALKAYSWVGQAPVQRTDVNEGLRNTLIILRNKLKRGVAVELELDAELPAIQAYGGELNQVWTNLMDNAVDAMEGEGRLVLRTAKDGDGIVVEVEDDGPGIPEAIQGRIFDPFFTTKEPGHGTGLGLNTTYNVVVKKHGGRIELDSRPGRTCFRVHLPIALDEVADSTDAVPSGLEPGEDEP